MHQDIDCEDIIFHLNVFLNVFSNSYLLRKPWHIDYKDMGFHLNVFSCDSSNCYLLRMPLDTDYMDIFFTCVYCQVILQMTISREGLRTLIARIWLFTHVLSVFSNHHFHRRAQYIDDKYMAFHLSVSSSVSTNAHFQRRTQRIEYKDMVFTQVHYY